MKISYVKPLVKEVLENYPETRDDDNKLLFTVWETEKPNLKYCSYNKFKDMVISGELSHFESIRRNRQTLQNKYPYLQGKRYNIRHTKEVAETEKELGYIRTPFDAPGMKP